MGFHCTEEIIQDIADGKMVVIVDDEDRENEGDLIMASSKVRPEDINFMARYGRGLICMPMTRERCQQLKLPLMVHDNLSPHGTNFTVSIEASEGVTTGISAADRAKTVQAAVAENAVPADLVQPGHIFPLVAQPGGVLTRAGHTEAGVDLARLAGLEPSSVIVEILNEDGSMARRPELEVFAKEHGLKIGTIADLINYRINNEKTVERVTLCPFETEYGEFRLVAFQDAIDNGLHLALVKGQPSPERPCLVRVHMEDVLGDMLGGSLKETSLSLQQAIKAVAEAGEGVVVLLRSNDHNRWIVDKIHRIQKGETSKPEPNAEQGATELRTFGVGAQILHDLGVKQMKLLSSPKKMHGLSGFGLEVVEYVSLT